ncbi:type II toxin-antitoxin system RelE/ParE family toxin [Novosphingobium sp.]|uniref:type II toxin-antitoxin system RelE/ParE family toxin n=1 Tax=Novosphingobium sp. TaxID=1874826 RepID=UPI003D0DFFA8
MSFYLVEPAANARIDEIYVYTRDQWGQDQATGYLQGLFDRFGAIAARQFPWRPIPAEFGMRGYFCRYERHYIYWKVRNDGSIGIVTILHERMHQFARIKDEFGP